MKRQAWIGAVLLALVAGSWASAAGPPCFLQRLRPAGGCFPYPGGLLHWWCPDWFQPCCGPDDYCRKPLPEFGPTLCAPCASPGPGVLRHLESGHPDTAHVSEPIHPQEDWRP
jgi:hypothetical protein